MTDYILAGDIGGTKADLAIFGLDGETLQPQFEKKYDSAAVSSAVDLIDRFLQEAAPGTIASACFGFAGPVLDGRSRAANLKWDIDQHELQQHFGLERLVVINDLTALSYAIPHLAKDQLVRLKEGTASDDGGICLLAAGTGLGEAFLCRHQGKNIACPSEGGHRDFCPRTSQEFRLLQSLQERYGHVSTERVLSGAGLVDIFLFLLQEKGEILPDWLPTEEIHKNAALITARAKDRNEALCVKALHLFSSLYGAEAGNIALQYLATGGVYIGGGIGPKIELFLNSEQFRQSFTAKGRMKELLEAIPVFLIVDEKGALQGAARYAASLLTAARS